MNFFFYTPIFFKHSWDLNNFKGIRELFCPQNTANGKCIAPISSKYYYQLYNVTDHHNNVTSYLTYFNVTSWCEAYFNATDCESIRNAAINKANQWGGKLILIQSVTGLVELLIICWSIYIANGLLTAPVITQSMLDVINYLLVFPIAGCAAMAKYFWWVYDGNPLASTTSWMPIMFLVLAIAQILALPLGIISGRLKSRILLQM